MIVSTNSLAFGFTPNQPIFDGFDWDVSDGERWAVLGPSGCGKSTLLLLLAGILKPTAGEIFISGKSINRPRPRTGLILQEYGLLPWATVQQNYGLGHKIRKFYGPDGKHSPLDQVSNSDIDWLDKLGLGEIRNRYPSQISGGQQQRTAIARTLSMNPDLLLMDEPFGSLDAPTSTALQNLIIDLNNEDKIAMIMVTHSVETAAFVGEKILVLGNPPNISPLIINNPKSGSKEFRKSEEYQNLCLQLHSQLETSL